MPRKTKKTPVPKKGTRKSSKTPTDLDGSITQVLGDSVSNVLHEGQIPPISVTNSDSSEGSAPLSVRPPTSAAPVDKSDAILAYLQCLDQSNQALTKRVMELETNRSTASTPHNARTRSTVPAMTFNPPPPAMQTQYQVEGGIPPSSVNNKPFFNDLSTKPSDALISATSAGPQPLHPSLSRSEVAPTQAQFNTDGVLPSLSILRQNQVISHSCHSCPGIIRESGKGGSHPGKGTQRKSGRFNNTDSHTSSPV